MPTYISLVNLTEQGIKEFKNAPERLQFFDEATRQAGGRLIGFYLVMGQYDYIVITEAPDDQTAARLIMGTLRRAACARKRCEPSPAKSLKASPKDCRGQVYRAHRPESLSHPGRARYTRLLEVIHRKDCTHQAFGVVTGQPVPFQVQVFDDDVRHQPGQLRAVHHGRLALLLG